MSAVVLSSTPLEQTSIPDLSAPRDRLCGKQILIFDAWLGETWATALSDHGATSFVERGVNGASKIISQERIDFAVLYPIGSDVTPADKLLMEFIETELKPKGIKFLFVSQNPGAAHSLPSELQPHFLNVGGGNFNTAELIEKIKIH